MRRDDTFWTALEQVLAELSATGTCEISKVDWDARLKARIKLLETPRVRQAS